MRSAFGQLFCRAISELHAGRRGAIHELRGPPCATFLGIVGPLAARRAGQTSACSKWPFSLVSASTNTVKARPPSSARHQPPVAGRGNFRAFRLPIWTSGVVGIGPAGDRMSATSGLGRSGDIVRRGGSVHAHRLGRQSQGQLDLGHRTLAALWTRTDPPDLPDGQS
jgi:hypothetical protein